MIIWQLFYIYQQLKYKNDKYLKEKIGYSTLNEIQKLNEYKLKCKKNNREEKILWFHAESIGESFSVISLVKKLCNKNYFIIFTTNTTIGKQAIRDKLKDNVAIQYFPYPNKKYIKRFYDTWRPEKIFFIEDEIYPTILSFLKKKNKNIYLLNARMSNKSFKHWKIFKHYIKTVLLKYDFIFTQTIEEKKKFKFLTNGYKNIECIGNLKISSSILNKEEILNEFNENDNQDNVVAKCKLLKQNCENRKIIVFGSIHSEEFFYLVWQYVMLTRTINIIGIFAPRNINEINELERILRDNNIASTKWTDFCGNIENNTIIVDTIGELSKIYNICDIAVVCGSFAKNIGGHNPLEPISLQKNTFIGEYCEKCKGIVNELVKSGCLIQTSNLYADIIKNIHNPVEQQLLSNNSSIFLQQHNDIDEKIIKILNL